MIEPWFALRVDGRADPRQVDPDRFRAAIHERRCWVSGEKLGETVAFVVCPEELAIGATIEPPMRPDMAHMAVRHCPHLSQPERPRRREATDTWDDGTHTDNPGPAEVIVVELRRYEVITTVEGDLAFRLGEADRLTRYRAGFPVEDRENKQG